MAHYVGYLEVPHGSFQEWRNATYGNGYDVDGWFGEQCWDYVALLYWQYGLTLYTRAGGGGAQDCWLVSRAENSRTPFISLTGKQNIKRGDILVFGSATVGHISFADEDYNPSHPSYIASLGQNQAGNGSGYPVNVVNYSLNNFLGIFRNTYWNGVTPPPTPDMGYNKSRYNFVLFNRRKRQEKWTKKPLRKKSRS